MELNILLAQIDLKTNILKVQNSLDEIKEKNPHRNDLIDSMEQSVGELKYVSKVIREMEKDMVLHFHRIMTLERLNNELQTELKIKKF